MSQSEPGSWSFAESDQDRITPSRPRIFGVVIAIVCLVVLLAVAGVIAISTTTKTEPVPVSSTPRVAVGGNLSVGGMIFPRQRSQLRSARHFPATFIRKIMRA